MRQVSGRGVWEVGPVSPGMASNFHPANPTPLDRQDLGVVEAGAAGMRAWKESEQKLIEASRKERERRRSAERLLSIGGITAAILVVAFAGFAWWQWGEAKQKKQNVQMVKPKMPYKPKAQLSLRRRTLRVK